jgi:hypothetical protein
MISPVVVALRDEIRLRDHRVQKQPSTRLAPEKSSRNGSLSACDMASSALQYCRLVWIVVNSLNS